MASCRQRLNGSFPVFAGTELELIAHYRVSTGINFYALPVARILGRDFVNTILGLYKGRSENAGNECADRPSHSGGIDANRLMAILTLRATSRDIASYVTDTAPPHRAEIFFHVPKCPFLSF